MTNSILVLSVDDNLIPRKMKYIKYSFQVRELQNIKDYFHATLGASNNLNFIIIDLFIHYTDGIIIYHI